MKNNVPCRSNCSASALDQGNRPEAIIFEGRDAAGKGGSIKRFTEHLNPRGARGGVEGATSSRRSGTSGVISSTCPRVERSSMDTVLGTTVRVWNARDGLLHLAAVLRVHASGSRFERMLVNSDTHLIKFMVLQ